MPSPRPGEPFHPNGCFVGSLIPDWLMRRQGVSEGAKLCYARLLSYGRRTGVAWPSLPELGRSLGVSRRTVCRWVEELETLRLIRSAGKHGYQASTVREFLWHPWMEEEAPAGEPAGEATEPMVPFLAPLKAPNSAISDPMVPVLTINSARTGTPIVPELAPEVLKRSTKRSTNSVSSKRGEAANGDTSDHIGSKATTKAPEDLFTAALRETYLGLLGYPTKLRVQDHLALREMAKRGVTPEQLSAFYRDKKKQYRFRDGHLAPTVINQDIGAWMQSKNGHVSLTPEQHAELDRAEAVAREAKQRMLARPLAYDPFENE